MALSWPNGFLQVHIDQAENLPDTDTSFFNMFGKDVTDPFVTLKMGDVELFRTKTIKDDLNPKWDEKQVINVYQELENITVNVRDKESIGSVHVASVSVASEKFSKGNAIEGWFNLKNNGEERGKIKMSVQFFPKTAFLTSLRTLYKSDPIFRKNLDAKAEEVGNESMRDQIVEFKQAFSKFDKNGNFTIEMEDVPSLMQSVGKNWTLDQINMVIRLVDDKEIEGKHVITFCMFYILMTNQLMVEKTKEEKIRGLFRNYDVDGNGYISQKEYMQVLNAVGHTKFAEEEIIGLVVDANGDGRVHYEEFFEEMRELYGI